MIKVEKLNKSFGNVEAVKDLSFDIAKGEVVGFLGPNGAGKTTTMRLLAGYFTPDSGTIEIGGTRMSDDIAEVQKKIGYMPENNPLYKDMLVTEILALSADLKGIPQAERRDAYNFVVNAVSIADVFYQPIGELSKGYKQRVGMAVALLHRPDILILDEPTEGLDPNQRSDIRALIKDFSDDHTVIMSTHVMQEAQAVCDRLVIIGKGSLIADGTPEDLSRMAENERSVEVLIEGSGVDMALKSLKKVSHVDISRTKNGLVNAKLMTDTSVRIQPELSKLASDKGWTIWKLVEEEHTLEDVFHKLTSEL